MRSSTAPPAGPGSRIQAASPGPASAEDGALVLIDGDAPNMTVLDPENGARIKTWKFPLVEPYTLGITPDLTQAAEVTADAGTLIVYDFESGLELRRLPRRRERRFYGVNMYPGGIC